MTGQLKNKKGWHVGDEGRGDRKNEPKVLQ